MDEFARAYAATLDALTGDAASRIAAYYDPEGDYAGGSFLAFGPNTPTEVTAADLFAVALLNADIGARAARRVLADERLVANLQAVPTDVRLEDADDGVLDVAGRFYERLRQLFVDPRAARSDPWVAPAKLAARKRPWLLPVRDGLVRQYLGMQKPYSYRRDWQIYQQLMRDEQIRGLLDDLPANDPPLRILDVALWTRARQ
ncbi:DUF6308 family protein [Micromonospora sp. NPDC048930]|uniref:DUF6308 family protein n=1 Tax=Micromonospora sp. NPDC048930 TaxID=3364261 RepID=UPI003716F884